MFRLTAVVGVLGAMWLGLVSPASAQQSRCADCHVANPSAPGQSHVGDYTRSAHGRQNIGCESCHRGDPSTFEKLQAHRGIVNGGDKKSPVHATNLPTTCGSCHTAQRDEFEKTRHFELLSAGDRKGPTCVTCHGNAGMTLLSPKSLESQCNSCHGPGKTAPRPERAKNARGMLESVRDSRAALKEAERLIKNVKDGEQRAKLSLQASSARQELKLAVAAGHIFVYDELARRVDRSRAQMKGLFDALGSPMPVMKPVHDVHVPNLLRALEREGHTQASVRPERVP